jgi:hypothetical protein
MKGKWTDTLSMDSAVPRRLDMTEQTSPNPGSGSPESGASAPEHTLDEHTRSGEDDLESRRRWGDHDPGFPAGTGPQAPPAETEEKHSSGDRTSGAE